MVGEQCWGERGGMKICAGGVKLVTLNSCNRHLLSSPDDITDELIKMDRAH